MIIGERESGRKQYAAGVALLTKWVLVFSAVNIFGQRFVIALLIPLFCLLYVFHCLNDNNNNNNNNNMLSHVLLKQGEDKHTIFSTSHFRAYASS